MENEKLCKKVSISTISIGKLAKGENITVNTLVQICDVL